MRDATCRSSHRRRVRGLPDVVGGDPVSVEAQAPEVAVELQDIGAIAVGGRQRPVRGRVAVHEEDRLAVDAVEHPPGWITWPTLGSHVTVPLSRS